MGFCIFFFFFRIGFTSHVLCTDRRRYANLSNPCTYALKPLDVPIGVPSYCCGHLTVSKRTCTVLTCDPCCEGKEGRGSGRLALISSLDVHRGSGSMAVRDGGGGGRGGSLGETQLQKMKVEMKVALVQ